MEGTRIVHCDIIEKREGHTDTFPWVNLLLEYREDKTISQSRLRMRMKLNDIWEKPTEREIDCCWNK